MASFAPFRKDDDSAEFRLTVEQRQRARPGGEPQKPNPTPQLQSTCPGKFLQKFRARSRRKKTSVAQTMSRHACPWCGEPYTPRTTGGKRQKFCSKRCRRAFDSGCRAWAGEMVLRGRLPVSELKTALRQRARCSERFLTRPQGRETGRAYRALSAPRRPRRSAAR